jgi:methyl acetate hydrolase
VLEGFDGDTPQLRPPASKATIRQLMTHTAGCGYFFGNENLYRYARLTGLPGPMTGLKESLMGPLARDPGTQWEYGLNTDWLGLVVEAVSGQTSTYTSRTACTAPWG